MKTLLLPVLVGVLALSACQPATRTYSVHGSGIRPPVGMCASDSTIIDRNGQVRCSHRARPTP